MRTLALAAAVGVAIGPGGMDPQLATSFAEREQEPEAPHRFHISDDKIHEIDHQWAQFESQIQAHVNAAKADETRVERALREKGGKAGAELAEQGAEDMAAAEKRAKAEAEAKELPPSTVSLVEQVHKQARDFAHAGLQAVHNPHRKVHEIVHGALNHEQHAMQAWERLNQKMLHSKALSPAIKAKWAQLSAKMQLSEANLQVLQARRQQEQQQMEARVEHERRQELDRKERTEMIKQLPTRKQRARALQAERSVTHPQESGSGNRQSYFAHLEKHEPWFRLDRRAEMPVREEGTLEGGVNVAAALALARENAAARSAAYQRHFHQIAAMKHHEYEKAKERAHGPIYHPQHMPGHPHHDPLSMAPPLTAAPKIGEEWVAVPATEWHQLHALETQRKHAIENPPAKHAPPAPSPSHPDAGHRSKHAPPAPSPSHPDAQHRAWHPSHKVGDWRKDKEIMKEHQVEEQLVARLLAKLGGDRRKLASLLETQDAASLLQLASTPGDIQDLLEPMKLQPPVQPIELEQAKTERDESWKKIESEEKGATHNINDLLKEVQQMEVVDANADKQMRLHK